MMRRGADRIQAVMSGADSSASALLLRGATTLIEPLFAGAVRARDIGYRRGWLKSARLPRPTVSVGNLTTGGTGKTPVIRWLAERLREQGRRPAVLMRGYHADPSGISDEQQLLEAALTTGTYPVPVIANPDRVAGARQALARDPGVDVFLLDDGFQHRRVRRDFDLVLISAPEPFGYGHLLPRGMLREPPRALRRAHAVLITRASEVIPAALLDIEEIVRRFQPTAPLFKANHVHQELRDPENTRQLPLESSAGERVMAFCGIGDPHSFDEQLRRDGWDVVAFHAYADHHRYTATDLVWLSDQATRAQATRFLTTEKDWVKLKRLSQLTDLAMPLWVIGLEIRFEPGQDTSLFEGILSAIRRADKKSRTEEG